VGDRVEDHALRIVAMDTARRALADPAARSSKSRIEGEGASALLLLSETAVVRRATR